MDDHNLTMLALAVVTAGGTILGFALRTLYYRSEQQEKDLNVHKIEAAGQFVKRDELAVTITTLRAEGKALEDRLEKRFDKLESWMGRRFDVLMDALPVARRHDSQEN